MHSNLGAKIKVSRKAAGLTQRELGIKIGKGFSTIQKYENGVIEPPISIVIKIAEALGITPLELMETAAPWPGEMQTTIDARDRRTRLTVGYDKLNASGQEKAVAYVEDLAKLEDYKA